MSSLRATVVGTGFIGVVHVDALRRLGVEVAGVVGSTPARAREKARAAGLPEPYDATLMDGAAAATTHLPAGHAEGFADTFCELYRVVYEAVATGAPPASPLYPTFADGHEAALIGAAIARSAQEARWVTVDEIRTENPLP